MMKKILLAGLIIAGAVLAGPPSCIKTSGPDFSQVESDAFQVAVNRRYPIFYSEKRPFFMESKDVPDFTIIANGMMIAPVHTRLIADPGWATKLSGSAGKMNFVLLAANDRSAGWDTAHQPGGKLKVGLDYLHSDLKEKQTGNKIFAVDIYNL
ncbi:MAG: hypothetical protein NT166_11950 [Candidatus Aminicenantes bacterium]|nr:hypothetical protein [Candidatus Aminicenantes bacterium]